MLNWLVALRILDLFLAESSSGAEDGSKTAQPGNVVPMTQKSKHAITVQVAKNGAEDGSKTAQPGNVVPMTQKSKHAITVQMAKNGAELT